jgi:hypothetical protein
MGTTNPNSQGSATKDMEIELMMVMIGVIVMSHSCHDLLVTGAGVAICHGR